MVGIRDFTRMKCTVMEWLSMRWRWMGKQKERAMRTLVIIAVVLFLGALPIWPHSLNWGYLPSGGVGFILLSVVMLAFVNWLGRPATEKH
ncbi:MAG: hypothetical protein A4E19_11290 [Nitrospira sp. SG-bin1]|nr:MAG: hypothetical protein A4E19_11290 [Nitrospira sp. SG-bin1]